MLWAAASGGYHLHCQKAWAFFLFVFFMVGMHYVEAAAAAAAAGQSVAVVHAVTSHNSGSGANDAAAPVLMLCPCRAVLRTICWAIST